MTTEKYNIKGELKGKTTLQLLLTEVAMARRVTDTTNCMCYPLYIWRNCCKQYHEEHGDVCEQIRSMYQAYKNGASKEPYASMKAENLPVVFPSMVCRQVRYPQSFTGIFCIDIDGLSTKEDVVECIEYLLTRYDSVFAAAPSISGRGVYAFLYTECSDLSKVMASFQRTCKYELDKSCKNINRARFLSDLPMVWKPDDAIIYAWVDVDEPMKSKDEIRREIKMQMCADAQESKQKRTNTKGEKKYVKNDDPVQGFRRLMREMMETSVDYTQGYRKWFNFAKTCAAAYVAGIDDAYDFYDNISRRYYDYNADKAMKQWQAAYRWVVSNSIEINPGELCNIKKEAE